MHRRTANRPAIAGALLFPLSATSADALRETAARLADWVDAQRVGPQDRRIWPTHWRAAARHRPVRTAVLAGSLAELAEALREVADQRDSVSARGRPGRPRTGVGVLRARFAVGGHGRRPARQRTGVRRDRRHHRAPDRRGIRLLGDRGDDRPGQTVTGIDRVQPTLFAMQVALAATMKSYGVAPGAVIGHSLGEAAAAVVAGALSLEDGVRVICRRSRLMTRIAGAGAMASVELPAQQVLSELMGRGINDVVVAVVASPQSTVIGGATQTVRELVAGWEERDVMAREVAVDVASHSPQVDPILDELSEALADITPMAAEVPYYSATLFDPRDGRYCDAGYWVDNLRHTVRFAAAVQAALEDGYRVFAELSPHPLLTHAVEQTARSLDMPVAALAGDAARAAAAARAARTGGRSAQRGRRGGLLGALSRRAPGGRAAAGMDANVLCS